ncbi:amidase signature domain-containing protein [Kockovaella imperatae]|uniref:amidase n=1 Tax=Kockovaella imperatae TaxID=4999 RepID=A0A1Y1UG37_9TREE|nr:amidase signature domain-containing protein [Kockovaella imperatae]ORX36939.1 amidase signature domain-containing protein [Kockovaella imperatae]
MLNGNGSHTVAASWEEIAARKRHDREVLLSHWADSRALEPAPSNGSITRLTILTPHQIEITSLPAHQIVKAIAGRVYTSVEVVTAFIRAAVIAQDTTNCLTEICFQEGLARAQELDDYQNRTGRTVGPLHGLPVSIKDHIDVRGTDGASGFVGWAYNRIAAKDAVIVRCIRKAGGVIYGKTSNPQSLLAIETNNNIYGRTTNPYNRDLSAGGSSGGEGALIAMRGSPLGVGTDIAGSIRIPALWNDIWGLKPSVGRLPHTGLQGPHEGMDAILGCVGPLAPCLEDLSLFCDSILSEQMAPWNMEAQTLYHPWRRIDHPSDKRLTIAIMMDDGVVLPHPPILAAMEESVRRLKTQGHEIVRWKPYATKESDELLFTLFLQDQGQEYRDHLALSGEPAVPSIEWLLTEKAPLMGLNKPNDVWPLVRLREYFRQAAVDRWTDLEESIGRPVDAILCPGAPSLAPRHDRSRHWMYTAIWNLYDWPAITFPTRHTTVTSSTSSPWPPHAPRSTLEQTVWSEWDPNWYTDAPVGLQLVGRRLQEEKLLADMALIERALSLSSDVAS